MQYGLPYLPFSMHGFQVSAILNTGATQVFISSKLGKQLPSVIQDVGALALMLSLSKSLIHFSFKTENGDR